jgi:hypothetical protein
MERLNLPEHRNLEVPGSGAAAHMSLHLLLQCQRAHHNADNDFSRYCYRGEPFFQIVTTSNCGARVSRVVPVKRSLSGSPDSVNTLFHFCFKKSHFLIFRAIFERFCGCFRSGFQQIGTPRNIKILNPASQEPHFSPVFSSEASISTLIPHFPLPSRKLIPIFLKYPIFPMPAASTKGRHHDSLYLKCRFYRDSTVNQ